MRIVQQEAATTSVKPVHFLEGRRCREAKWPRIIVEIPSQLPLLLWFCRIALNRFCEPFFERDLRAPAENLLGLRDFPAALEYLACAGFCELGLPVGFQEFPYGRGEAEYFGLRAGAYVDGGVPACRENFRGHCKGECARHIADIDEIPGLAPVAEDCMRFSLRGDGNEFRYCRRVLAIGVLARTVDVEEAQGNDAQPPGLRE